jgi:hypothetical protein
MNLLYAKILSANLWLSLGLKLLVIILAAFLIVVLFFYFNQDKLIFFPQPISQETIAEISKEPENIENIKINTQDGNMLSGWLVKSSKLKKSPLVIYFGGNAEEVSHMIRESDKFNEWSLSLINYRGYGLSSGRPSEINLFDDAAAIYDYYARREDIDNKKIVVMGRSLGSGVAVYLGTNRPVEGVILVTPYDSMTNLARSNYPFLPVSLILKHRFDSISRAQEIRIPMLALVAGNDTTIPPVHAKHLVDKWGGKSTMKIIEGANHNSISSSEDYWDYIKDYLSQLK